MTPLCKGDPVRVVVGEWSWFHGMKGVLVEMRGERPLVLIEGDKEPTLFFAHEVAGVE